MSIVTYNRTIVPAVWPGELGRATSGTFDLQVRDSWQYVPETFEGICDWAAIAKDDDDDASWGRRHLVYRPLMLPAEKRTASQVVVVVLQGFLGNFNVTPLGNWDRDRSASSAMQYVTLEGGGARDAFGAQVRALRNIREFVSAKVGTELSHENESESTILLERPVFTKVRASGAQAPAITLSNISDPGARARKLSALWRVDHLIPTGARRENGHNMAIAPTALRRGDFIEVSAYVDIQLLRRKKQTGTVIKFAVKEVVRLWTAADAQLRFARTDSTASAPEPRVPKAVVVPSIFNIGEEEEEEVAMQVE